MWPNQRWFIIVTAATLFLGSLPYLFGSALTPRGAMFYGNKLIAPADYSIYYSYIHQGAQGHVFMYDAFTSEPQRPTIFQPLWFVVGLLARIFHLSAPVAFASARLVSMPILILVLWWAAGWIWPDNERRRRVGFVASILVSGLGAIATIIGPHLADFPFTYPDLWVSEAYTMLTLWSSAHFILVTSGIIFVLVAVERSWLERRWSWALWAGLVGLATLSIHPFHIITWLLLWSGLSVWRWGATKKFPLDYVKRWLTVVAIASPAILLYGLQIVLRDPLTIERSIQNVDKSATLWAMAIGLGLPLLLAILGAWKWKNKDERWRWLVGMALTYMVVAYLPVLFQRRLTQGIMVPLIWLSAPMIEAIIYFYHKPLSRRLVAAGIGFIFSSSWLLVGGLIVKDYFRDLQIPIRMYYIDSEHRQVADYIQATDPHQPLLTSLVESNVLAGMTSHQVYVGYSVETWNYDSKLDKMEHFFKQMSQSEQRQFLGDAQICYVLTSPRTRAKGNSFTPNQWPDLVTAWSGPNLTLYKTPYCR